MTSADLYRPFMKHFRAKRMARFFAEFHVTSETRILDVGGTFRFWANLPIRPNVTVTNLTANVGVALAADGRFLPFRDKSFDIVFSNSVIEHIPEREGQIRFARECLRVGKQCYIQTPNLWFPVEPHLLLPFVHWLPARVARPLAGFSPRRLFWTPTERANLAPDRIRLLGRGELASFFPDCGIWAEHFCGMTKSLIAVLVS